jgi:hypothetical protein
MRKSAYRKIYEAHHGPIPKDDQGRSYEIHHIDGNHNNNNIHNLKLVTIEEHYAIHKAQGDYVSAFMIAQRMKLSPEELSDIASKSAVLTNQQRIEAGTHNFLDSDAASQRNLARVNTGTHNLLKRADGTSQASDMVAAGRHHFVHNNPAKNKSKLGILPSQIKLSCVFCKRRSSLNNFKKLHHACQATEILSVV